MSIFIKQKNKNINTIRKSNFLFCSKGLIVGISAFCFTADAAIMQPPGEQLIFESKPDKSNSIENFNFFYYPYNLENEQNIKAKQLAKQGLEKIKKGDREQGLQDLQQAWNLNPNFIITGVMLSLNYLQNKDYDQALKIAKEIQQAKTQENYGLGYTMAGMSYAATGELDKATVAFKEAIRLIPNEKNTLLNLAKISIAQKNYSEAQTYLNQIISFDPTHLKALEQLAKIEFTLGNIDESNALLKKAISSHPEALSPLITLAQNYLKSDNYQDVLALTENKTSPALLEMQGKAYLYSGETEKAQQVFERLVKQQPKSAAANYALADFFSKTGNMSEAARQIQNTLSKDPKFLLARIGEIKTLFYSNKKTEAEKASQLLINEFGNQSEVLSIAGWLAMQQGNFIQAEKYFSQMAKTNQNTDVTIWWVKSVWAQKHYDKAQTIMLDWLSDNQEDIYVHLALADSYMGLHKKPEAKDAYLKIIEIQPKLAVAYNNLAWLEQEDDIEKAIQYAEKALSLEKENFQILDTLGMLLVKNGQIEQGSLLLSKAVKIAPDNYELLIHLAEVLVLQHKYTKASPILEKLTTMKLGPVMQDKIKALQVKVSNK